MIRGAGAAGLVALAFWATGATADPRPSVLVFAGPVSLNDAFEVLTADDVEYADAFVTGVSGGLTWDLPNPRWRYSAEMQLAKYFGSQTSWEVNVVPAMIHYVPKNPLGPLESFGFGLGFSYATEPPEIELARGEDTTREKWYWTLEAAFDTGNPDRELVLRIHHRSTGVDTIGTGRSTNAVVVGLRQYF
jgi:hypothetical protein